ncbi:MAG: DNA polymerase II large subunit [Candidatus Helarchaeota archaeon]
MLKDIPKEIRHYFDELTKKVNECYRIAEKARNKGKDPEERVEIPPAEDVASRVEELIGPEGVKKRIHELQEEKLDTEHIAFKITNEIIEGKFIKDIDRDELVKLAIRAGLCILTGGITAAPIEGLVDVKIRRNKDNSEYIAMFFSGPIRAAGGTAAAQAVMLGDYVRRLMKLDIYKPTHEEIERYLEEIILYKRIRNLQYPIKAKSIRTAAKNCPIEITGEPTENEEVTGYRNLWRVNTNKVRGGACLVLNDGIIGKAHKLMKIVDTFKFPGWKWLKTLQEEQNNLDDLDDDEKIKPKDKYISGVIAGRPIFSHPSRKQGFRIRYGRVRNSGLAAVGLNLYTMKITENFLVDGTQFITERPGKGSISIAVDSIEGPIVKLFDGSVIKIENKKTYAKFNDKIMKILYLGDVLIALGEFLENNHILIPSSYTEEWWKLELQNSIKLKFNNDFNTLSKETSISTNRIRSFLKNPFKFYPNEIEAIKLSEILDIPIHPKYTFFWDYASNEDILKLRSWLLTANTKNKFHELYEFEKYTPELYFELDLDSSTDEKKILELIGIEHFVKDNKIIIGKYSYILTKLLVLDNKDTKFEFTLPIKKNKFVGYLSGYKIRAKAPYRIGGRMGRPEKANERAMFHTLFPIGLEGGNRRDLIKAANSGSYSIEIVNRKCPKCNIETISYNCPKCKIRTKIFKKCTNPDCNKEVNTKFCPYCKSPVRTYSKKSINLKKLLKLAQNNINETSPKYIKGVKGLMNQNRIYEPLEKAILRSKWELFAFRDGTIRFDAVDAPMTHFKPREIGINLDKLKKLGYKEDIFGMPIEKSDQIIELKFQDIIIPYNGAEYLFKIANFIDELLVKFYNLNPYYNVDTVNDIIGQIVIGLAPHTSAGIIGRVVGFTKSKICYAHPYWHSAKRRNCDGDEDSIILLLDALLNFSRLYLPYTRGGMMDAPLVISIHLHPEEVDKEVYNIEVINEFPLEFYEASLNYIHPKKLLDKIPIINHKIGKPDQYFNFPYTIPNSKIDSTPSITAYKKFEKVKDKVEAQLNLGIKIDAVDVVDEVDRLLKTHFIPDLIGNIRAFTTQQVRCHKCNIKYRRIPLSGKCENCNGDLIFTVHEGGVVKYLNLAKEISEKYGVNEYVKERLELTENNINSLFKHRKKNSDITKFLK